MNQSTEICDGAAGLLPNQQCGMDCQVVPICGNGVVEGTEACDDGSATCVGCQSQTMPPPPPPPPPPADACMTCIAALPDVGPFYDGNCKSDTSCAAALDCILDHSDCWQTIAPAACYCGDTQAAIDQCETPSFVPTGRCATALKAGAGTNATNAEVLARYFDPAHPSGIATIIVDAAFTGDCKAACF